MPRSFFRASSSLAALGVAALAAGAEAQTPDHIHSHAGGPVSCTTLTSPPWEGLPTADRSRIESLQSAIVSLRSTDAAYAAGYRPALGDIPTMGVHWVRPGSARDGIDVRQPDHLLFAPFEGEERLVGVAYAFTDVPNTDVPVPFESDLAHWHDHPQFAAPGQTLHMLHVWFVPSSNGPFAGNNFWLPFHGAGIQPPNSCWMETESERIQQVAMTLAASQLEAGILGQAIQLPEARRAAIREQGAALDTAARANDQAAWVAAADRLLEGRSRAETIRVNALLRGLTMAQMPSSPQ